VAVSPDGTKAYVTNQIDGTVSVINTTTDALIGGPITVGNTPRGVAVTPDGTKAYVTNFNHDTVSVINTTTNAVDATITVGSSPSGVASSPDGTKVYVANFSSDNVSVINTTTNAVSLITGLGLGPNAVAVSPDGTKAYVTQFDETTVSVIDLRAPASAGPGVPGIFLAVNDVLVGSQVTGAPVYCGADSIQPNSIYTLSIQSVTNSALTRIILDSGSVNSRGHLDETVLLPKVNPGSYKIVMTGIHASGNLLVLTNFITIGANGGIVSVSPESQQPFLK
jgi:YVTN family beta-propeller protein